GVVADDRRGGLLRVVLPSGLLAHLDAEPLGAQDPGNGGVVLEVGAGGIPPRVATTSILLAEQPTQRRAVFGGEPPFLADAMVPVLGERFGHLDAEPVEQEIVLIAVLGEELGSGLADVVAHGDDLERRVVALV